MLEFLGSEANPKLRERAALAIAFSTDKLILSSLDKLLAHETDPGARYALQIAIGAITKATSAPDEGLSISLEFSGLDRAGDSGSVSLEVHNQAGDGFVRVGLTLPDGLSLLHGDDEWHGLMRLGESKQLTVAVSAPKSGIYYIGAIFWLKRQDGTTFKGASQIKRDVLRLVIGPQQPLGPALRGRL